MQLHALKLKEARNVPGGPPKAAYMFTYLGAYETHALKEAGTGGIPDACTITVVNGKRSKRKKNEGRLRRRTLSRGSDLHTYRLRNTKQTRQSRTKECSAFRNHHQPIRPRGYTHGAHTELSRASTLALYLRRRMASWRRPSLLAHSSGVSPSSSWPGTASGFARACSRRSATFPAPQVSVSALLY